MKSDRPASNWTPDQREIVERARPEAISFARFLASQYPVMTQDEILAITEDALLADVPRFDPTRGTTLVQFARRRAIRDVVREARKRIGARGQAQWDAVRRHAEALEPPDLETRMGEDPDAKAARVDGVCQEAWFVGILAAERHGAQTASAEELLVAFQTRKKVWDAVAAVSAEAPRIIHLLYVEERTFEETAATLGVTVPSAKYQERVILAELRKRLSSLSELGHASTSGSRHDAQA